MKKRNHTCFERHGRSGALGLLQLGERAHDEDAHLNGAGSIGDICGHERAVFSEGGRQILGVLTALQGHIL
jgi:hypothetical protein